MKTKLVPIGNSKGIRIPSAILKQCKIDDQIELEIEKNRIVLTPINQKPRVGWDSAFKLMHERQEDMLLIDESMEAEMEDWEWK